MVGSEGVDAVDGMDAMGSVSPESGAFRFLRTDAPGCMHALHIHGLTQSPRAEIVKPSLRCLRCLRRKGKFTARGGNDTTHSGLMGILITFSQGSS